MWKQPCKERSSIFLYDNRFKEPDYKIKMAIHPAECLWLLLSLSALCWTQPGGRLFLFPPSCSADLRISPFLSVGDAFGNVYLYLKLTRKKYGVVGSARILLLYKVCARVYLKRLRENCPGN
jgi:hypothetical protein